MTTGLRERGNDTSGSTGRSGRQNAATRRNMRREERVTVQGPVKTQPPDGRGFSDVPSTRGLPLPESRIRDTHEDEAPKIAAPNPINRVTVQGPIKEQQPDGMSHRGSAPAERLESYPPPLVQRRQSPEPCRGSPTLTPFRAEGRDKNCKALSE